MVTERKESHSGNKQQNTKKKLYSYLYRHHSQVDYRFFLMYENLLYLRMYNLVRLFLLVVVDVLYLNENKTSFVFL